MLVGLGEALTPGSPATLRVIDASERKDLGSDGDGVKLLEDAPVTVG